MMNPERSKATPEEENVSLSLSLSLSLSRARQKNKGFLARWSSVDWTSVDGSPFVVVVVAFLELWRDPISFG
jgi:hypothetical protein